ncbi:MAG: protein kinase [Candidatus Krumholzibacteria bacterium]|nr:protein kinase [Candidatus Krumholzibacteria bacterium]
MQPGTKLDHYEITGPLGKGGMGEVYRARDSKLGRDVAIKVLPTEMSQDPERLARFDREARTLATLQHANVASIYGFESAGDAPYLVMELADGEDLSERLKRGAIPVEETVDLAIQIAKGLAAAHTVGIIHRDLKPANIKISTDGKLKILDFGLARAAGTDGGPDSALEHSPTLTAMTMPGVILGTAAYMSPEQARGTHVDHRADIWAFGVVLFGMLTGGRVFEGDTVSDTLAGVLRAELPWDQLPKDTAPTLRHLLERCLERDPSRRLQAIAEARIALEDLTEGRSDESAPEIRTDHAPRYRRERLGWIAAIIVLLIGIGGLTALRPSAPVAPLVQSTILPPADWDFAPASPFAISPDGNMIAFVAVARPENETVTPGSNSVWIRDLAESQARRLADSNGDAYPFWSPDGRWLGFYAGGKLNKIEARGGPIIPLCDATDGRGGSWSTTGTIIFQSAWSEGLMQVPSRGGTPTPLTTLNKDRFHVAHRWPHFLPDGQHFLFFAVSTTTPSSSQYTGLYIGSLAGEEPQLLLNAESRAVYAQGHLLYRTGSTLMAHPFDPNAREFTGDPEPVATDIPGGTISWGGAQFGASTTGTLVHMRGVQATNTYLNWRDRSGQMLGKIGDLTGYFEPNLSNDGTQLAVSVGQSVGDIWIYDLDRDLRTRFTFNPTDDRTPLWSPDDSLLAYSSTEDAEGRFYVRPASGQDSATLLYSADVQVELTDWSNDGRLIFFNRINPSAGGSEIWAYDLETSKATVLLSGQWFEDADLSPDGKWLAFTSDESGKSEVHVQSFPEATGRWMVSSDSGPGNVTRPVWSSDGRELFYLRGGAIVVVPVTGGSSFSFGEPQTLFSVSVTTASTDYAVSVDGQRILTNELPPTEQDMIGARLIQNWVSALER